MIVTCVCGMSYPFESAERREMHLACRFESSAPPSSGSITTPAPPPTFDDSTFPPEPGSREAIAVEEVNRQLAELKSIDDSMRPPSIESVTDLDLEVVFADG